MVQTKRIELDGQVLEFETGRLGKQAGGAVTIRIGDTMVFSAATMSSEPRDIDFFPLTCDYEERMYAVGKIPGSYFRREGRPGERGILTSRLMDRPIRPLFPDGMRNDVQVVAMPLSVDPEFPPDIAGINAASAALTVSDVPWNGPIGAVRVSLDENDNFILNPTRTQINASRLDLVVAGTADAIIMVEAGASEVPEDQMLDAMLFGHKAIQQICAGLQEWREQVGKAKREPAFKKNDPELLETISSRYGQEIRATIQNPDKATREDAVSDLKKDILARVAEEFPDRAKEVGEAIEKVAKKQLRSLIIEERIRPDGRRPDEIRQITCEIGILPRAHGSALFTRGQTQVLSIATLGGTSEDQMIEGLGEDENKTYMHHYNFPPYSVGETRPMRGPGRREIGHGALAERSLRAVLPDQGEFPYVMRVVSEVLESNGSTSMASTCGSTLSLMDAGVPLKAPVAGIAMGLMTEGDKYTVLSDIQGMEDFGGDMDFKVAGTRQGITAIQMDTKSTGIPRAVLEDALEQARKGRLYILDKMEATIAEPREELSAFAPRIITVQINPEKIGELIGPGGKMIKKIQADTGAKLDVEQDGRVFIAAVDQEAGERARSMVEGITKEAQVGEIYTGPVTRLMGKGAMIEYAPGKEGLIPTPELSWHQINRPDDVVRMGDTITAKVIGVDSAGRVDLSRKATINKEEEPEPPYLGQGGPGGGGGGYGGGGGGFRGGGGGGGFRGGDRGGGGGGGFRGGGGGDRGPRGGGGGGGFRGDRDRGPRGGEGAPPQGGDGSGEGAGGGEGGAPRQGQEEGVGARFRPPRRPQRD